MGRHIWKLVSPIIVGYYINGFVKELAPGKNALPLSIITGLSLGLIIGAIMDSKRNRRIDIRKLNNNINKLNQQNISFQNNKNVNNSNSDAIDQLYKLSELKDNGKISEEEFIYFKKKVMSKES